MGKVFNKKNCLPYLKYVLRLYCVVHGQIYGRFMGIYVNGFFFKTFHFRRLEKREVFSPYELSLYFERYAKFELALPVKQHKKSGGA